MGSKNRLSVPSEDWFFHDENGKPISNFIPKALSFTDIYSDGKPEPQLNIKLRLFFQNGHQSEDFSVAAVDLPKVNWLGIDEGARIYPGFPKSKASAYFEDSIQADMCKLNRQIGYQVSRLGTHTIDGEPVFCTGGGIIFPPLGTENRPAITPIPMPYNLDIDPNLSEESAVAGMLELISLSPDAGRIILVHTLLYLMRQAYKDAWKAPCCCVFLYGETGTKKTTYSALLTQVYNRKKGISNPIRLNSSVPAALDILYEKDDCIVVLDDLFPSESRDMQRQQEKTLYEIARIIADGIESARKRGNKVSKEPPTCGVLFTGEYIIGTGSDAARLLPVELLPSPDGEKLKPFQDNTLLVSTFYYFFISWYVSRYTEIQKFLAEWREAYNGIRMDVHARLKETHFFFNSTYVLLLQYCFEKKYISKRDVQTLQLSFQALLTNLVQEQQMRVNQGKLSEQSKGGEPAKINYLEYIRKMYKNRNFRLAGTAKQFDDEKHDGLLHYDCLCLRGKKLHEKIRGYIPSANFENVISSLLNQNAINRGDDDKITKQIYGCGGKRFYAIWLKKLK